MRIGKYEIKDRYILGPLAAGALFLGAAIGVMDSSNGIEFKTGTVERKHIIDGLPEHKFPTLGVFLNGKISPYITHVYENEGKRDEHDPAMTLISSRDNGLNDVRITSEKRCEACHKTSILKYGPSLDLIGF